jgi:hypothetical protein
MSMKHLSGKPIRFCVILTITLALIGPCRAVNARERLAIEAMMFHTFSQDVVSHMLPIVFTGISSEGTHGASLSLVDTVYCGSQEGDGTVKFLGLLYPGELTNHRVKSGLGEEDCSGFPSTILKRIIVNGHTPQWIGLVELKVQWTPWQVEFIPVKLHGLAKSQHPTVSFHLPRAATRLYQTSPMNLAVGDGKAVPVHVALGVAGNAFVLNGLVVETPPVQYVPRFLGKIAEKLPPGTNAIVAIPHAVANTIFTQYLAGETYAIQLTPSAPTLVANNPSISGSRDRYRTASLLGLKEHPDAFTAEVEWTGPDLHLTRLSLTARHTACGSDVVCQIKKSGLDTLGSSLTHLLTAQYKDTPLRSFLLQDIFSVTLNEKDIRVHAEVLRAEATVTDLILYTKLTLKTP